MVDQEGGDNNQPDRDSPPSLSGNPVDRAGDGTPSRQEGSKEKPNTDSHVSEEALVRLTRALVRWTGVLAIATIGMGIVGFFQWRELRKTDEHVAQQAEIAAGQLDEMRAGQRAWVTIETVEINGPLILQGDVAAVELKIGLRNVGAIPAVQVWSILHLYPDHLFKRFPPDCEAITRTQLVGINLLPNEFNDTAYWQANTKAGGESTAIPKENDFGFIVVGCVLYESFGNATIRSTGIAGNLFRKDKAAFNREKIKYEAGDLIFRLFQGMGGEIR